MECLRPVKTRQVLQTGSCLSSRGNLSKNFPLRVAPCPLSQTRSQSGSKYFHVRVISHGDVSLRCIYTVSSTLLNCLIYLPSYDLGVV